SGELVGISMASKPVSCSTCTWSSASSGLMPRKMAISGNSGVQGVMYFPYSVQNGHVGVLGRKCNAGQMQGAIIACKERTATHQRDRGIGRDLETPAHIAHFRADQQPREIVFHL